MSSPGLSVTATAPERMARTALSFTLRTSLAGMVGAVVLLGYVQATRPHMYLTLGVCIALYLLARGGAFLRGALAYATSDVLLLRWAFVLWALASLFWVGRGGEATQRAITLIEIHVVGAVLFDAARNLGYARWILKVVFVAAALGALHSLVGDSQIGVGRLEGAYGNPNTLAVTSLVGLAVFYSGIDLGRGVWLRGVSHILAGGLSVAVLASSSLKGMLGLVFLYGAGFLMKGSRRRASMQLALAVAAWALLARCVDSFQVFWDRAVYRAAAALVSIHSSASFGQSLVKRLRLIEKGMELIARSPVVGHGLDSFRWMSGEHTYAHNNYIDVGVALGMVGLALFYGFYARLLLGALRSGNGRSDVGRFLLVMIPMLVLLEAGAVTYLMKTVTFVLLVGAGWLEFRRVSGEDEAALSPLDARAQLRPAYSEGRR